MDSAHHLLEDVDTWLAGPQQAQPLAEVEVALQGGAAGLAARDVSASRVRLRRSDPAERCPLDLIEGMRNRRVWGWRLSAGLVVFSAVLTGHDASVVANRM